MQRYIEITVGLFVALGLIALMLLSFQISGIGEYSFAGSYQVQARFGNIGQLKAQAPVKLAGVIVGRVESIYIDARDFAAVVQLRLDDRHDTLPEDTSASIVTSGLLGEQYVALAPGGSDIFLADGGEIIITSDALVMDELISQFIYRQKEE